MIIDEQDPERSGASGVHHNSATENHTFTQTNRSQHVTARMQDVQSRKPVVRKPENPTKAQLRCPSNRTTAMTCNARNFEHRRNGRCGASGSPSHLPKPQASLARCPIATVPVSLVRQTRRVVEFDLFLLTADVPISPAGCSARRRRPDWPLDHWVQPYQLWVQPYQLWAEEQRWGR